MPSSKKKKKIAALLELQEREEIILQICLIMLESGNRFYPLYFLTQETTNILIFLASLKILSFSVPLSFNFLVDVK